ncbi:MAG: protein-disulfide reductase DsbD [Gammaproteobacteria bacterium]
MNRWVVALVAGLSVVLLTASAPAPRSLSELFPAQADPFSRFLPVDEAFRADARALDANTVSVRWVVADEYYLYRHRFSFAVVDVGAGDLALGEPVIPPGESHTDEFFGTVQIHRGTVSIRIPVQRADTGARDIGLELGYQGCADAGLCYPPEMRRISVRLPEVGSVPVEPAAAFVSDQDRLAGMLADGRFWLVLLTFYGLGLLLTFTPCVLPMVPILSGIIIGHGPGITARKGFLLSLVYVLAMALTYTAAGVAAALLGRNLQAFFQHPAVLVGFAAVFVLLALAMFGFYRLEMPAAIQSRLADASNRRRGTGWTGVAVMGVLSALIVGPCVAAPLAGALIYIGQTGDAVLGGSALFALSMGMGTLLLVIGASAGKLLPKAGPWMNAVKSAFGVLMLAVAIWLLERILPPAVTMMLWAALAIGSAMFLGAFDGLPPGVSGWRRLWKGVGLLLFAWGLLLLVGAASGARDPLQPLAGSGLFSSAQNEAPALPFRAIKSLSDLEREVQAASADSRTVMLDFYADWCVSCKEMERYTFPDPAVRAALADTTLLKADVTRNDAVDRELMQAFGILGPPSILFFGTDGEERRRFRVVGFMPAPQFAALTEIAFE